jgi:protein-L-isoaspartate O-methyltransferase
MKKLLNRLKFENVIKSDKVYNAMLAVDRSDFTDPEYAYVDT